MEIRAFQADKLSVRVFDTRQALGAAAAADAAARIRAAIEKRGEANVIFAAAPSQNELLAGLAEAEVDWSRVRAFHQDEYIGIDASEPAGFGNFLNRAIFDRLPFMEKHYLLCEADAAPARCAEYAALLRRYPPDLILLGIGENGHLAFNDPAVADFEDPEDIKIVDLDPICRQQQVNDGCFASIEQVPKQALTLTLSFLMRVPEAVCVVPGPRKANAVCGALKGEITEACPASVLRRHPCAALYLDRDSAARIL